MLLNRQNSIITDILGDNSNILMVTGEYHVEGFTELHPINGFSSIKQFSFIDLDNIDLHKLNSDEYEQGQVYKPMFSKAIWSKDNFDDILRDIAQDNVRVFFMSVDNDTIVAPYDGGVDFVLKDTKTKDNYKNKYRDWLSDRDDGL